MARSLLTPSVFPAISTAPSSPALGTVYYDSEDGLVIWNGSAWVAFSLSGHTHAGTPGVLGQRYMAWYANYLAAGTATTTTAVGHTAATLSPAGTIIHATDNHYANQPSGAISGNAASVIGPAAILRAANPEFRCRFRTGSGGTDLTAVRLWVGLTASAIGTMTASATPNTNYAAFRYDTVADGTVFWRCVVGTNATPTVVTTTTAIATDTAYALAIVFGAADVKFYINGTLVATIDTTIPAGTVALAPFASITTLAAGAKAYRWNRMEVLAA